MLELPKEVDFDLLVSDVFAKDGSQIPGRKVLCRADNKEPLAWVSDTYRPLRHRDVVEAVAVGMERAPDSVFVTGRKGQTMYANWRQQRPVEIAQLDDVILSLQLRHSISGMEALSFECGMYRLICKNGATAPIPGASSHLRRVHSRGLDLGELTQVVQYSNRSLEQVMPVFQSLRRVEVDGSHRSRLITGLRDGQLLSKKLERHLAVTTTSSRTLWDLYNNVTYFTTHHMSSIERKREIDLLALSLTKEMLN